FRQDRARGLKNRSAYYRIVGLEGVYARWLNPVDWMRADARTGNQTACACRCAQGGRRAIEDAERAAAPEVASHVLRHGQSTPGASVRGHPPAPGRPAMGADLQDGGRRRRVARRAESFAF